MPIELPDSHSIKMRLEEVSDDKFFREDLIPRLMKLAGITLRPEELVDSLETKLSDYADERMLGIKALALIDMPEIIHKLVDDEDECLSALIIWDTRVAESKELDRERAKFQKGRRGYRQPKLPRTQKKQLKKNQQNLERRGTVKIDPKRLTGR